MTTGYGDFDRSLQETESLRTFARGLELGINFVDTAWAYQSYGAGGGGNLFNEELVGKALKVHGREKFVVATKFSNKHPRVDVTAGKEAHIRAFLSDSLQRLDTDYIDLYYQHRMDPATPIEETVGVLKKLVEEGVVRYIGLSECTPDELRRAHAVHPVTAIQMEWSLQTRDIEDAIVPLARELGVAIVAYSPLGRGFLAALNAIETLDAGDWRRNLPRFSGDLALENARLATRFFALAEEKGCTAAQLAWPGSTPREKTFFQSQEPNPPYVSKRMHEPLRYLEDFRPTRSRTSQLLYRESSVIDILRT